MNWTTVTCITPRVYLGNPEKNADEIIAQVKDYQDSSILLFPELSLTGYTCGDLFFQKTLQEGAVAALKRIRDETANSLSVIIVGLPFLHLGKLYNCAAVLQQGKILGLIPKIYIPENNEYYEKRWFTTGKAVSETLELFGDSFLFSPEQVFYDKTEPNVILGVEICEDLWAPDPPSLKLAAAGAVILANPSASNETIAKAGYRAELIAQQSARLNCAYLYCSSGFGESSQDLVFGGDQIIAEKGIVLERAERFQTRSASISAQIDVESLLHDRSLQSAYRDTQVEGIHRVGIDLLPAKKLTRKYEKNPFVPGNADDRMERCEEILKIQSTGLATRMAHLNNPQLIVGVSGGLDSTLALIVSALACDMLGLGRDNITAITMPGFGTTGRTYDNAVNLIKEIGAKFREIPIREATREHLKNIGHPEEKKDATYENAQARERTQILMDVANQENGLVVGTGDLSELALGWATYNGDHMSMYGVNAGVPKTLVRYLVDYYADQSEEKLATILKDVLDTPVSPELLPPDSEGKIAQKTEERIGPYELHDFFLFHLLRNGSSPQKIFELAQNTFDEYDDETILKWLKVFLQRFFTQQYKRSTLPDGPKVGSVTLSPRGDLRMPSDISPEFWLRELDKIKF